jgi:hypothetical protein
MGEIGTPYSAVGVEVRYGVRCSVVGQSDNRAPMTVTHRGTANRQPTTETSQ